MEPTAPNENDNEKLKQDFKLKVDEFFNCAYEEMEYEYKNNSVEHASSPSGEVSYRRSKKSLECDSNLLKYCVPMDLDGKDQIPLGHIDGFEEALENCCIEESKEIKPSSSKTDFQGTSYASIVKNILNYPLLDTNEPQVRFIIKRAISLNAISRSKGNLIQMNLPAMDSIKEYNKPENFYSMTDFQNAVVKHESDEFCTFCSCKECIAYRKVAIHVMMEQFKASHMIVLLLDALLKAYIPLLRNTTAFNGFENLLENNRDVYWIGNGLIYNKKYEHLDLTYDKTLTDPMKIVLFSSILMINNPMQLLQILSFHIKCIVKAFAVGINEVPPDEKLAYIIDGFDHLCLISKQVASHLFVFEKYFLNKFSLNWVCLCQRLFRQHVYMKFLIAITNSGESLKNDDPLKNRYFDFAKRIFCTDMRWNRTIWPKLQRYNLSDVEVKRRKCMLKVHHLFDVVVEDALRLPLEESIDNNLFYDIHSLDNRRLAWQNIMAFAKMKWPDGFFNAPNTLVLDFRCEKCSAIIEQHESKCKCVTCSIAGDPFLPPSKMQNTCLDCRLKQLSSKLSEDSQENTESGEVHEADDEDVKDLIRGFVGYKLSKEKTKHLPSNISKKMGFLERFFEGDISELGPDDPYHISWATFKHLNQRERYTHETIDEKYFCQNCNIPACMLARKLLNNEISPELTTHLISYFHPLPLLQQELRALLPNIVFYNQRLFATKTDNNFHNVVVKAYWTFIVSLYTIYFFDFGTPSPLNLSALEIDQSDIKLIPEKLKGNPEDTQFFDFLSEIQSFAPQDTCADPALILEHLQKEDVQQKLDEFLRSHEKRRRKILSIIEESQTTTSTEMETIQSPLDVEPFVTSITAVTEQPTACNAAGDACSLSNESLHKKSCNSRPKKCCLEHAADLGADHCKENHSGKKRLKKDCNHARINETRDRLRKKLQNARRDQQQQNQQRQQQQTREKTSQTTQMQNSKEMSNQTTSSYEVQSSQPSMKPFVETPTDLMTSRSHYDAHNACNKDAEKIDSDDETLLPTTPPLVDEANLNSNTENLSKQEKTEKKEKSEKRDKPGKVIGKVIEICDMIDNNKIKMKKWIDETLTYIEGYASTTSSSGGTANANKKNQPQTKNPKKAAKKAKQKLRKEEEKRIGELHELRTQFQVIYFKEFVEKIELKNLKSSGLGGPNKRRCDKKKITEIEANIKKLQRAKAKLEGYILELIATVKQTNTEFKFPYLPTKEQQQEKILEIEQAKFPGKNHNINSTVNSSSSLQSPSQAEVPDCNTAVNVFNYTPTPSAKFFPNISFPYEMSFPGGPMQNPICLGFANGPPLPQKVTNTMCYAPPPQQLSANVMATIAANENSKEINKATPNSDPSKRIVTIRRVHNPNLCDSQVTVTARGSSPNEDKLLYTFINGQLVPTTGNSQVQSESSTTNFAKPSKPLKPSTVPETVAVLTKSQLKKKRRLQAKLALAQETLSDCESVETKESEQADNINAKQKITKPRGKSSSQFKESTRERLQECSEACVAPGRSKVIKDVTVGKPVSSLNGKTSSKKNKKDDKKILEQSLTDNKHLTLKKEVKSNSERKPVTIKTEKKQTNNQQNTSKTSVQPVEISSKCEKEKAAKKEQRRHKVVNQGQFDNNPYKTLHFQDSDSELEVSASSCDEEIYSDIVERNDIITFEEVSKTKSKLKQPKQPTNPLTPFNAKNVNSARQRKDVQHEKPPYLNSATDNFEKNGKCPAETKKVKSAIKTSNEKLINNTTSKSKKLDQHSFDRRSMLKVNNNRKDPNKQTSQHTEIHCNDEEESNEKSLRLKKDISITYKNSVTRTNKLGVKPIHTPELLKRTASSSSNSSKGVTLNDGCKKAASKRSQRTKKKQDQEQQKHSALISDVSNGIPTRMEHFNSEETNFLSQRSYADQLPHLDGLTHQFQELQIRRDTANSNLMPSYASVSANKSQLSNSALSNVSIMDQLNRGVQVENLSLPPGITLTKVDPIKSEQLRQKSESIRRLSQPLQSNSNKVPMMPGGFQHHGSTIVAPPIASYLPAQYIQSPSAISGTIPLDQGNIIMVESLSAKPPKSNTENGTKQSASSTKLSSKSKRRRNKGKRGDGNEKSNTVEGCGTEKHPKMITLRNPMFHAGPAAAAATILQQPGLLANRHGNPGETGGVSIPTPLPLDQPAAIIKNENGMFTIRNPALHQAVTNGLAMSGYRQFGGNISYYTPQEAMAEAARTAQHHKMSMQKARVQANAGPTESFSYFSNNLMSNMPSSISGKTTVSAATSPTKPSNNSISCTGVNDKNSTVNIGSNGRSDKPNSKVDVRTESSVRPSSAQRCLSAIGSEIKNRRNTINTENLWSEHGQQENSSRSHENLSSPSTTLVAGRVFDESNQLANTSAVLQRNYQRSSYYNGFEVFPSQSINGNHISTAHSTPAPTPALRRSSQTVQSNSLFDVTVNDAHIHNHAHHSCGDDSPPPTSLLGYSSSYLDDIPNTGVIRYDDASFLKNLIPGQRLNKEVSIHNINESNYGRPTSPLSHLVEITPVYSNQVSQSQDNQSKLQQRFSSATGRYTTTPYDKNCKEFDSNVFPTDDSGLLNYSKSDTKEVSITNADCEPCKIFNYDFETPTSSSSSQVECPKSISDVNSMFKSDFPAPSQRTSPFLDATTMESFVQNLNALQINSPTTRTGEQCPQSQTNGDSGRNSEVLGNTSNTNSTNSTPANGWW